MTGVLTRGGGHVKTETETGGCNHSPGARRTVGKPQRLEEAGRTLPEDAEGAQPCPHLDLGLLASTLRENEFLLI